MKLSRTSAMGILLLGILYVLLFTPVRDAVGTYLLEFVVLGRIPGTSTRIGLFGSVMMMLTVVMILSLYYRSYSFELTSFKLRKAKEEQARTIIQPTVDLEFEEAIEELEAASTSA